MPLTIVMTKVKNWFVPSSLLRDSQPVLTYSRLRHHLQQRMCLDFVPLRVVSLLHFDLPPLLQRNSYWHQWVSEHNLGEASLERYNKEKSFFKEGFLFSFPFSISQIFPFHFWLTIPWSQSTDAPYYFIDLGSCYSQLVLSSTVNWTYQAPM